MDLRNKINWEEVTVLLIMILLPVIFAFVIVSLTEARQENSRIQRINGKDTVYYDTQTNVMYLAKGNGICVMVDESGKPLLYEGGEENDES